MAAAKILELTEVNTCKLCNNALGKYTCPKCNILYCSLTCYQSDEHLQCSESFYRDCVIEGVSAADESENAKDKMLEILRRIHEENAVEVDDYTENSLDSDDDDDYVDLSERLAGVDLDDPEKVWEQLNTDERQEFEAFLRSNDVTKLIPLWEPWWTNRCDKKVFDVEEFEKYKEKCPKLPECINDFSSICKVKPADSVQFNLVNVLSAYVFTLRYFNGEHFEHCKEAVTCIATLSPTLNSNHNFVSYENAVDSIQQECLSVDWLYPDEENINLMKEDVGRILDGPHEMDKKFYVLCALSDLCDLFRSFLSADDGETARGGFSKMFPESQIPDMQAVGRDKVKLHVKKAEYFLSYTKDCLEL